jgi:hypothetical protein
VWPQVQDDLAVLLLLLRVLRWAGRIKQDITLWADTLGRGLAQELDYVQVGHFQHRVHQSILQEAFVVVL